MEMKEWLASSRVTVEDVGKTAVIVSAGIKETKFGAKMCLDLDIGNDQKELFLSKNLTRDLSRKLGSDEKAWIGKQGVIQIITLQVQGKGLIEKAIFAPIEKTQTRLATI